MDIKALQWELAAFVVDRGLDPLHTPRNLSMALAAEAGALLALFKWATDDAQGVSEPAERDAAADALADAVLHAVNLADRLGIDLDEAIRRKLAKNAEKYPVVADSPPPAPAPERRVEPEKKAPPQRPRASVEPEFPRPASRPAPAAPPPREPPWATRSPTPPSPVAEPPPLAPSPPPARAARTEPPPPPPEPPPTRAVRVEPPPPPPARAARVEPPPPPPPPARAARVEPPPPPSPPPEPEVDPYADLDTDAARRLVDALSKQVNRARSDDPLARELHDEVTTLKRTLYADDPKRAWVASSLKSIRRILEEATSHSVGAELRAAEHLAEVERILDE